MLQMYIVDNESFKMTSIIICMIVQLLLIMYEYFMFKGLGAEMYFKDTSNFIDIFEFIIYSVFFAFRISYKGTLVPEDNPSTDINTVATMSLLSAV